MKRLKSGETMLYYLACTECGCEYAIDEDGELQERTYFIEGYQVLLNGDITLSKITEVARRIGFSEDRTRRCIAYFCTRLLAHEWSGSRVELDASLLERLLLNIRKGTKLKVIQQWECWESYQQFLVYRFHPEVMRALIELKRPRPSKRSDTAVKREKVREALDTLLEKDEDITLGSVCNIVGVSPETIRSWGCNADISRTKKIQQEQRFILYENTIREKIDKYLEKYLYRMVLSSEVHDYLGINRTVLWHKAPNISAYISERLAEHNRL